MPVAVGRHIYTAPIQFNATSQTLKPSNLRIQDETKSLTFGGRSTSDTSPFTHLQLDTTACHGTLTALQASSLYFAYPYHKTGSIAVWSREKRGRLPPVPPMLVASQKAVVSFAFSPHDPKLLVSVCREPLLKWWKVEEDLTWTDVAVQYGVGHEGRIESVLWHPTATGVCVSASTDQTIRLWALENIEPSLILQLPEYSNSNATEISSLHTAWDCVGNTLFASRGRQCFLFDPRAHSPLQQEWETNHHSTKPCRLSYLDSLLFSVGYNSNSTERCVHVWDVRKTSESIQTLSFGPGISSHVPHKDDRRGHLYLHSKSEPLLFIQSINASYTSTPLVNDKPVTCISLLQEDESCQVQQCEIMRYLKLTSSCTVDLMGVYVPRQEVDVFASDLYPDWTEERFSAEQWFNCQSGQTIEHRTRVPVDMIKQTPTSVSTHAKKSQSMPTLKDAAAKQSRIPFLSLSVRVHHQAAVAIVRPGRVWIVHATNHATIAQLTVKDKIRSRNELCLTFDSIQIHFRNQFDVSFVVNQLQLHSASQPVSFLLALMDGQEHISLDAQGVVAIHASTKDFIQKKQPLKLFSLDECLALESSPEEISLMTSHEIITFQGSNRNTIHAQFLLWIELNDTVAKEKLNKNYFLAQTEEMDWVRLICGWLWLGKKRNVVDQRFNLMEYDCKAIENGIELMKGNNEPISLKLNKTFADKVIESRLDSFDLLEYFNYSSSFLLDAMPVSISDQPYLLRIQGKRATVRVAPSSEQSLHSEASFLWVERDAVSMYHAENCLRVCKAKSMELSQHFQKREKKSIHEKSYQEFCAFLGKDKNSMDEKLAPLKIMKIASDAFTIPMIYQGWTPLLNLLASENIYIIEQDRFFCIQWIGKQATLQQRNCADKLLGMYASCLRLNQGNENVLFREWFLMNPLAIALTAPERRSNIASNHVVVDWKEILSMNVNPTTDENVSTESKITIFRIDQDKSPCHTSYFISSYCYLIHQVTTLQTKLYLWQGQLASISVVTRCALEAVEMGKFDKMMQMERVEQGKESVAFLRLFPDGFVVLLDENKREKWLQCVGCKLVEWPLSDAAVHPFETSIFINNQNGIVLNGESSNWNSIVYLKSFSLETKSLDQIQHSTILSRSKILKSLGNDPFQPVRLFQCTPTVQELGPITLNDLTATCLLMIPWTRRVYLWWSREATVTDKRLSLTRTEDFLKEFDGFECFVTEQGNEPLLFRHSFPFWTSFETELEEPLSSVLSKYKRTQLSFEELKELPEFIDPTRLEAYLEDKEFERIMGMERKVFELLPEWRREILKRKAKLF